MTSTLCTLAAGLVVCAAPWAAHAQSTSAPASCGFEPTVLDQKLMSKADRGVPALRDYVFITRGIYGMSIEDAVARIEHVRAAQRCSAVALADPQR